MWGGGIDRGTKAGWTGHDGGQSPVHLRGPRLYGSLVPSPSLSLSQDLHLSTQILGPLLTQGPAPSGSSAFSPVVWG